MLNLIKAVNKKFMIFAAMLIVPTMVFAGDVLTCKPVVSSGDSVIEVVNNIEYTGSISAIAVKVDLPDGVEFVSSGGDAYPAVSPRKGDTGLLEFAWVMPPSSPFTFVYTVNVDKEAQGEIYSQVVYRRAAGALVTEIDPINVGQ